MCRAFVGSVAKAARRSRSSRSNLSSLHFPSPTSSMYAVSTVPESPVASESAQSQYSCVGPTHTHGSESRIRRML